MRALRVATWIAEQQAAEHRQALVRAACIRELQHLAERALVADDRRTR